MKEKFIDGIYNYCDRWCERCDFTSRCRTYESTSSLTTEQLDISNKAFWENISLNLINAFELLLKAAQEHGIDLDKTMAEEEVVDYKTRQTLLNTAAKQHQITKLCKKYRKIALPFVQKSEGFTDKTRELVSHLHLGLKTEEDAINTVADIGNSFEVIQWYLFFIDAKLQRALKGKMEGEEREAENGYQKDSDGSAKIAIIAIERSMGAWTGLYSQLPISEDTALNALALLEQLKQKANEEFPDAMKFKRPGFDD